MILDLALIVSSGLEMGRDYGHGAVAVYSVPGVGRRRWAVVAADGAETLHERAWGAALGYLEALGVTEALVRRRRHVEARKAAGWRRVGAPFFDPRLNRWPARARPVTPRQVAT